VSIFANDGGVRLVGETLQPINITTVSMDYERLNITCKEEYYEIEAYIELYNHENKTIEPFLGFEFHRGGLDSYSDAEIKNIFQQYITLVNSEPQKFDYKIRYEEGYGEIHTLVFQPKLKPGKNIVYHKFHFPYGFGSSQGVVSYILKTSSRWRNSVIKNLEIFIRTEKSTIILFEEYIDTEQKSSLIFSFDTIGESKLYKKETYDYPTHNLDYYSMTPNGYLYKRIENFTADKDIRFQLLKFEGMEMYISYSDPPYHWPRNNSYITIYDWKRYIEDNKFRRYNWRDNWLPSENMLKDLSAVELRILRNTLYAIHGYVFNDNFLKDYFNKQYWYFPNPNIAQNEIVLSQSERKILEYITAEEKKR